MISDRDADGHPYAHRSAWGRQRFDHRGQQSVGHSRCVLFVVQVLGHDHQVVVADAGHGVRRTQPLAEALHATAESVDAEVRRLGTVIRVVHHAADQGVGEFISGRSSAVAEAIARSSPRSLRSPVTVSVVDAVA